MKIKIHNSVCDSIDFKEYHEFWLNDVLRADCWKNGVDISYGFFHRWRNARMNWNLLTNEKKLFFLGEDRLSEKEAYFFK